MTDLRLSLQKTADNVDRQSFIVSSSRTSSFPLRLVNPNLVDLSTSSRFIYFVATTLFDLITASQARKVWSVLLYPPAPPERAELQGKSELRLPSVLATPWLTYLRSLCFRPLPREFFCSLVPLTLLLTLPASRSSNLSFRFRRCAMSLRPSGPPSWRASSRAEEPSARLSVRSTSWEICCTTQSR